MAAKRKIITYFLEDQAQQVFITAIVERLAQKEGISIREDSRSVMWGGRPLPELARFIRDEEKSGYASTDLLIVSIDGNCHGWQERKREVAHVFDKSGYHTPYVCAIPDPHIERWYLCDGEAVRHALSAGISPNVPSYKCARDVYKKELHRVIREAGLEVIIGGAEHGQTIAAAMDFYKAGKTDPSLGRFVDDLQSALRSMQ